MDSEKPKPNHETTAIIALTGQGVELALRLKGLLPGSTCFLPLRHAKKGSEGFERVSDIIPAVWPRYRNLVCIMATGIVVRLIAPLLSHKSVDPAVVVLDERGRFAISLVSGHLGGANRLACEVAELIGAESVVTTASDVQGKPAVDLMARDAGLEIENVSLLSRVARAVIEEEPVWVFDPEGRIGASFADYLNAEVYPARRTQQCEDSRETPIRLDECRNPADTRHSLRDPGEPVRFRPDWEGQSEEEYLRVRSAYGIWVSELLPPPRVRCLKLRPRNLVVGIGCNRQTGSSEIIELVKKIFRKERLSLQSIRNFASIDLKSDEPGILEAATAFNRPVVFFSRDDLGGMEVPHPSAMVEKHIGVQSVCEAAALLSAQSRTLVLTKRKTANVTLAVARVGCP